MSWFFLAFDPSDKSSSIVLCTSRSPDGHYRIVSYLCSSAKREQVFVTFKCFKFEHHVPIASNSSIKMMAPPKSLLALTFSFASANASRTSLHHSDEHLYELRSSEFQEQRICMFAHARAKRVFPVPMVRTEDNPWAERFRWPLLSV